MGVTGEIIVDGTGDRLGSQTRQLWWGKKLDPPNWNATRYNDIIDGLIGDIRSKSLGERVLNAITGTSKAVLIVPEPVGGPHASRGATTLADQNVAACVESGPAPGSDCIILFTPANVRWMGGGSHAVEILLHELVHALRAMRGEELPRPLTSAPFSTRYANLKEFVAITVTNVYASQKGWYLRRSHDWSKNSPPLSHNEVRNFFKEHETLFEMLSPCPGFLPSLTRITANFNPFRDAFGA